MNFDEPARVLSCFVSKQTGIEAWPLEDDAYWAYGENPKDYRWRIEVSVNPQKHSCPSTRKPFEYDAMDVRVGDYIANVGDGTAVKIISIEYKSSNRLNCVVEDTLRYNTMRDASGLANGMFVIPSPGVIFSLNEDGLPVIDPMPPMEIGSLFYPNLMSRFQNVEAENHIQIEQENHGFLEGQFLSANKDTDGFSVTSEDHPLVVGRVVKIISENKFFLAPVQRTTLFDFLPGEVGDILYANATAVSGVQTAETPNPVLIKLRNGSGTSVTATESSNTTSSSFTLNGTEIVTNGSLANIVSSINQISDQTGIFAELLAKPNIVYSNSSLFDAFQEPLLDLRDDNPAAVFDGVHVSFTTYEDGFKRYGEQFASALDIAKDINSAFGEDVAYEEDNILFYKKPDGGEITISNSTPGTNNQLVVGPNSGTGLPFSRPATNAVCLKIYANDARAIDIHASKTFFEDTGVYSVENGQKAIGLTIEDGGRQSKTFIVSSIAERDNLVSIDGDQAFVIDKGDGEWGQYIYNNGWFLITSQDFSGAGGHLRSILTYSNSTLQIGEVSGGKTVTSVSVQVLTPFSNGANLTIGTVSNQQELMQSKHCDLQDVGTYVTNPQKNYSSDTQVSVFLSGSQSILAGLAVVTVVAN